MTEPKNFQKGKHTYTRYGSNFKEVHVPGKSPASSGQPPARELSFDVDPITETGVYSNISALHRSQDEVVLDFGFLPPGQSKGRIRARIVLSPVHVRQLSQLLKQTLEEMDKSSK